MELRRLAYKAKRSEGARQVLHDALLETWPDVYTRMIEVAEDGASQQNPQFVVLDVLYLQPEHRRGWSRKVVGHSLLYVAGSKHVLRGSDVIVYEAHGLGRTRRTYTLREPRAPRERERDADYRGQPSTVDWSRLVHETRLGKPGALEVLQDAIMIYFPEQFKKIQEIAKRYSSDPISGGAPPGSEVLVGFSARIARRRFEPIRPILKQGPLTSPFFIKLLKSVRTSELDPNPYVVFVWSTKSGLRPVYVGSYRRPKIPILYYDIDESETELALSFHVRGRGAGAWAENQQSILGQRWDIPEPDFAYAIVGWVPADWRKRLRREGYKNRLVRGR